MVPKSDGGESSRLHLVEKETLTSAFNEELVLYIEHTRVGQAVSIVSGELPDRGSGFY